MAKKATGVFLTLALLFGIVVTYYYVYISKQESYVIDRNFRLLALWSDELTHVVDDYKRHFEYISSAISEEDEPAECGKPNSQQKSPPPQCPENVPPEDPNKKCDCSKDTDDKFKEFKNRFEKKYKKLNEDLKGTLASISRECKKLELKKFVDEQPRIRARLSSKDKDLFRLIYSEERTKCQSVDKDNFFESTTVQVDLSIGKIINHLIKIDENIFNDVIVFDSETGTVHFQKDHYLFRIDDFRDLVVRRPDTGGESALFSIFSDNAETTGVRNGKEGSSPPPLKHLLQNPTHRRITIGDVPYELFTQPVVLPELTIEKPAKYKQTKQVPVRLILTGLMKTEKFESESRAIPHTWLLACLFFVLLGLLSLPIIHLGLMDYREPLSLRVMFSILFTCVVGTAIITLFFLDTTWLSNVRHRLDNQLKITAEKIKEKFKDEVENTLGLLRELDHSNEFEKDFNWVTQKNSVCPCDAENACKHDRPDNAATTQKFKLSDNACDCTAGGKSENNKWVARRNVKQCNKKFDKNSGKFCDLFFWVDQKKNSRITWNTDSEFYLKTSNISLAHRDYVNRILDPDPESSLWHTELKDGNHVPFYAQPVHSLGIGKHMVIFSMESSQQPKSSQDKPFCEDKPSCKGKPEKWVAAFETDFKFLKSVAIPHGTGFAVIEDEGGKVLFHSDANRNLWENFIEETDNNAQLTANVLSRTPGKFGGTYWGKGHAFYSTPLPDVPWSLVVFRNKELLRTTNFEALLLASTLFAVYLVILSIGPAVRWLFNKAILGKRDLSWFWPDSGRLGWDYIVIGLMAGIFFLAGIILFAYGIVPGESAVWVVFPYLLFSGMLIWMTTKCCDKRAPKPSPKIPHEQLQQLLHGRYTFAVISLLLLFSALPMATFFKIGTDREMLLAMKYNLITLGHKLRRAPDPDFSQIQATGNCTKNGSPEACLQRGIHLNVFANTELVVSGDRPEDKDPHPSILDKFHRFIRENSLSRLSNHVSIETLGLLVKQPPEETDGTNKPDEPFYWEDVASSPISLTFQAPIKQSGSQPNWVTLKASPFSYSWFSIKDFPDKRHVVSLIVFIAGVLVIVLVPLFIVRRIFPILPEPSSNPLNGDYEDIWQRQTPSAQVTLYNLAKDGFVHAENPDLVTLSQDRLIKVQPAPGWLDDDFEKHVLIAGKRDGLDTKQQKSQSQWQVWKVPLVVVFIVLAMGLLLTQEEFSNVVVLMLSALPVLLPTLSELIGSPQTGGKAGSDG